ncbi:DUF2339 domain-containing protein [Candidatus Woesebacteria bacterium]|nr:DUF2339 domain-containing protein [Candidatus Woesebacteria bacterium]
MEIFTIISLALSIYALVKIGRIESQLKKTSPQAPDDFSAEQNSTVIETNANIDPAKKLTLQVDEPGTIEKFISWYVKDWPLKTGALFILLGFIWLTTYAFLNNWIGETGRITFGLIAGALILYGGELRLRIVKSQGITLVGLGSSVMVVTVYAAQNLYQMFPPLVALCIIMLVMVLIAVISLRHKQLPLAVMSIIIAGVAPALIGSSEKNIVGLYSYLLAITIGVVWLARYSKWRILLLLSLFIVSIYSLEYFFSNAQTLLSYQTPQDVLMLRFFALTFIGIYFLTTLASIVTNRKATMIDLQSAIAVGLFTMAWINGLVHEEYKAFIIVSASLLFALGSYATFVYTKLKEPVYAYTAVAVVMLAVATGYAFDGPVLAIAFALEAFILPIVAIELFGLEIGKYMFFYYTLPFVVSLSTFDSSSWNQGLLQNDFYSLTVVTLSFLLSGMYFYYKEKDKATQIHTISLFILITGCVYGLIWIWKVFHSLFSAEYLARMVTLLVYSLIGLQAYVKGEHDNRKILYRFGMALLIFVVARLLVVEVWDMQLAMRIVTFFVIGLLFIGSVLIKKTGKSNPLEK